VKPSLGAKAPAERSRTRRGEVAQMGAATSGTGTHHLCGSEGRMGAKGEPQQQGAAVATRARAYDDRRRGGSVVDGEGGRAVTTREQGQHRGDNRSGTCVRRPARGVSAANGARDVVLGPALALGGADAGSCFGAGPARRVRVPAGIAAETNAPGGAKRRRSGPTPEDVGRCRCYGYYCCGCACRGAGVLKCCGRRQRSWERSGEEKKTCVDAGATASWKFLRAAA
jgi:hypothetical protein